MSKKFVRDPKDELEYILANYVEHQYLFIELITSGTKEDLRLKSISYQNDFNAIGEEMFALILDRATSVELRSWECRSQDINRRLLELNHWINNCDITGPDRHCALASFAILHAYKLGAEATLKANDEQGEDPSEEQSFSE